MNELLEHAARVLDHQPTRSMQAEPLYRRTIRETGTVVPFPRFMNAVRERTDRFAVIPPDPVIGSIEAWDPRQRSLYEAAMEAAGMTQPLIVLAERLGDPHSMFAPDRDQDGGAGGPDPRAAESFPGTAADVFRDVHAALTHLLHATDPDDALYTAVTAAMEELHAARRALKA